MEAENLPRGKSDLPSCELCVRRIDRHRIYYMWSSRIWKGWTGSPRDSSLSLLLPLADIGNSSFPAGVFVCSVEHTHIGIRICMICSSRLPRRRNDSVSCAR